MEYLSGDMGDIGFSEENAEDVSTVQRVVGVYPSGNYDNATMSAVAKWQTRNGMAADGVVTDEIFEKMTSTKQTTSPRPSTAESFGIITGTLLNHAAGRTPPAEVLRQQQSEAERLQASGFFSPVNLWLGAGLVGIILLAVWKTKKK